MTERYTALVAARGERARQRLVDTHPCNPLCGDETHVDLVYAGPDLVRINGVGDACAAIKRRYEWLHEVEVMDVRPVEAPPPDASAGWAALAGAFPPRDGDDAFGVWWRLPT